MNVTTDVLGADGDAGPDNDDNERGGDSDIERSDQLKSIDVGSTNGSRTQHDVAGIDHGTELRPFHRRSGYDPDKYLTSILSYPARGSAGADGWLIYGDGDKDGDLGMIRC